MASYHLLKDATEIMTHALNNSTADESRAALVWAKDVSVNLKYPETLRHCAKALVPVLRKHLKEYG